LETDTETIRGVTEGVLLADDLVRSTPMLKHLGGMDLRGHLRRAGIMFRLDDLCKRGILPFSTSIVAMPHGPWHWLEIKSGTYKAHVCRTNGVFDFPEDTLSRQDERLRNQDDLFKPRLMPLAEIAKRVRELYAWLTFGVDRHGAIQHLCWTMPPADESMWLAHINILERAERASKNPTGPLFMVPPKKLKLEFRDHVEEKLSDLEKKNKERK
jgi:hypothetical protein